LRICGLSACQRARAGAAGVRGARVRPADANDDRTTARVPAALTRSGIGSGTDRRRILKPRPTSGPRTIDRPTQQAMAIRMASSEACPSDRYGISIGEVRLRPPRTGPAPPLSSVSSGTPTASPNRTQPYHARSGATTAWRALPRVRRMLRADSAESRRVHRGVHAMGIRGIPDTPDPLG
jgi:hypothetical protein